MNTAFLVSANNIVRGKSMHIFYLASEGPSFQQQQDAFSLAHRTASATTESIFISHSEAAGVWESFCKITWCMGLILKSTRSRFRWVNNIQVTQSNDRVTNKTKETLVKTCICCKYLEIKQVLLFDLRILCIFCMRACIPYFSSACNTDLTTSAQLFLRGLSCLKRNTVVYTCWASLNILYWCTDGYC